MSMLSSDFIDIRIKKILELEHKVKKNNAEKEECTKVIETIKKEIQIYKKGQKDMRDYINQSLQAIIKDHDEFIYPFIDIKV